MEKITLLKAQIREQTGSRAAVSLRREGQIPAVVYGHKQDSVAVSIDRHDFVEALHHGRRVMDIRIGKKTEKMMVKDIQYDYLGKDIIHADLMRVDISETVMVNVQLEFKGTAAGVHEGGIVVPHTDHLEVECKVTDIPEIIVVSVKELHIGDFLHASQIELPAGVRLISSPEILVVACTTVAAAPTAEQAEEGPAAPELIKEEKEEEQGQEQ